MNNKVKTLELRWLDNAKIVDLPLIMSRGHIEEIRLTETAINYEVGKTRIRFTKPYKASLNQFTIELIYRGESPISKNPSLVTIEEPESLIDTCQKDIELYMACRRKATQDGSKFARARKLFLKLDERTHPDICSTKEHCFEKLNESLLWRIYERVKYGKPSTKIESSFIAPITCLFETVSPYSTIELGEEMDAYLWFAAGLLEHQCPYCDIAAGPNSGNIFMFGELASAILEQEKSSYWSARFSFLVLMQEIYRRRFSGKQFWKNLKHEKMTPPNKTIEETEIEAAKEHLLRNYQSDAEAASSTIIRNIVAIGGMKSLFHNSEENSTHS